MPWLMKAEPDSRVVKGKDVKFSVDDFEKMGVSPWDGVRNHEAKSIMRDRMKLGDRVLFYHSNCKTPGVFAVAEVAREGYADYTAWDPSHPYFDEKTKQESPTWYMVDVKFIQRLPHPPTLVLIKTLAASEKLPDAVHYIGEDGLRAIKGMQLVNRGRLSVQTVDQAAYEAVVKLGTRGGWESLVENAGKGKGKRKKESAIDDVGGAEELKPELGELEGIAKEDHGIDDVKEETRVVKKGRKGPKVVPADQIAKVEEESGRRRSGRLKR